MSMTTRDMFSKWQWIRKEYGWIVFIVVLLLSNLLWKATVRDDGQGGVSLWGVVDVSAAFDWAVRSTAWLSYHLTRLFIDNVTLTQGHLIGFENRLGIDVVWGCTALKQSVLFTLVMAAATGSGKRKWSYVACCWVVIYLLNVLRITTIALVVGLRPAWEDTIHDWIMKYGFYACLFVLWVIWQESERREKQG